MHVQNSNAPESSSEASSTGRERFIRTKRKFRPAGYVLAGSNIGSKNKAPELESSSSSGGGGDWKVVTETELESLLGKNIEESFREAVKKLAGMGYNPEEVSDAIISCGYKAFPGLVDCAMLNCVKHADNRVNPQLGGGGDESISSTLDVKALLNEMVNAVRDDRPGLTRADAMWCLLMSDLDVKEAFKADAAQLSPASRVLKPGALETHGSKLETQASSPGSMLETQASFPGSTLETLASPGSTSETQASFPGSALQTQASPGSTMETQASSLGSMLETQASPASTSETQASPASNQALPGKASASTELSVSLDSAGGSEAGEEKIKQLSEEVRLLKIEVIERTEWARSKVLQAAQRLSRDVSELRKLRAEKEQASRAEESSLKRFSDLETALRKTGTQLDQTRSALQKLEMSNAEIRAELEAAKLSAAESVASCLQASKIEKKALKKAQSWDKQRVKLHEDLARERKKVGEAQQQLAQSREKQLQAEAISRQESKAREEAVFRMEAEKLAREQAEVFARMRVEMIQTKSESDLRFYREEIQKLEQEVSRLKSGNSNDSTPAPFSLWASTGFIAPVVPLERHRSFEISSPAPAGDWQEFSTRRDRECVMCLCDEMSVVFLPCAHQVVCIKCNELHQKQGMNECPSCRTRIQQRIRVYGATS